MPAREPKHKGVGLLPVVRALRNVRGARELVQGDLWRYLEQPILASGWYPERDYDILIQALASTVDPRRVGGNVWSYFGRVAAQRDLAGTEDDVPERSRTNAAGLYRRFLEGEGADPGVFFQRLAKIWQLYHDSGRLEFARRRSARATVVARLNGFKYSVQGLVDLQTGYLAEFARLAGARMTVKLVRSTASGDPFCEWEFAIERTPALEQWLLALPER